MIKDIVARREFENEYREIFVDFENLELEELKQLAKDIQYLTNKFKYFAIMEEINQNKSKFPKKDEKFNEFWLNKCENPFLNKLKEVIKKNKGCQQIVKEELPITPGFSYGDDRMTIYYLLNILEIKENFENIKQYSLNTDKKKIYYHCWY